MPNWNELGMGAAANVANTAIGAGLGLMLEKHNDKRQLNQQAKLQAMQIQGQKDLTDYNTGKQMEMWRNTSYPAQMEMLKQAGLNPGLIYGMGGAGGQSTNIAQGTVAGADAPKGGGEAIGMGMMMAQLQLVQAQKENIEADTKKKEAEIPNIGANTQNILADTANKQVQKEIMETESFLKNIEAHIAGETQNDAVAMVRTGLRKFTAEMHQAETQNRITQETAQNNIAIIATQYTNLLLQNDQIRKSLNKTDQEIEQIKTQIEVSLRTIANAENQTAIDQQLANFTTSFGGQAASLLSGILPFIMKKPGDKTGGRKK